MKSALTYAYKYSPDDVLGKVETCSVHLRIKNEKL
jgi:hypothetical protein